MKCLLKEPEIANIFFHSFLLHLLYNYQIQEKISLFYLKRDAIYLIFINDLIKEIDFYRRCAIVIPDSLCFFADSQLFVNSDTCYFFLIKWSDAKRCTWDEIREQKRYRTWVVTRDKDGNYDKNIRYLDSDL